MGKESMDANNAEQPAKRHRVYEEWQGNEKFFCWGYLVAGPNWRAAIGTAFLLLAPAGIFLGFVAPYVTKKVHAIIMVFSCLLPVLCAVFLALTSCRDPGIIPRREPDDEYLAGRKPRTKEVEVNGQRVLIRYNDTCHFYQPPRAHHCSVNDNAVHRFDHHCPWTGTTVGRRNYRSFLLFIFTATILCLYVMGVCLAQLFLKHQELVDDQRDAGNNVSSSSQWGQAFRDVIPALVLMFYTFLFVWFVGGLSGFHIYLSATNQTTYENFRYNHDNRPNPYDRGILKNCAEIWCTPIPPSEVKFRAFIDEWPYPRPPQADVDVPGAPQDPATTAPAVVDMEMGRTTRGSYSQAGAEAAYPQQQGQIPEHQHQQQHQQAPQYTEQVHDGEQYAYSSQQQQQQAQVVQAVQAAVPAGGTYASGG